MEILKKFEPKKADRRLGSKYDELLDGKIRRLKSGEDFTIPILSLTAALYSLASKRGVKIRITREGTEAIVVQRI